MTPAQNITRHYGGDWQGHQGAFPTPGHSPSDRGMTVRDADNGEVVFYCHNGDDAAWRGLKDECRRLGLLPERQRSGGSSWRETGRYEYVDADGTVAYRTVRIERDGERKQFRAQRPNGQGGWINGLDKAAPRILYRLPDILTADPARPVYLTEGERKADKLASWGMPATAIAFGAKGWRDTYARTLTGRVVIILPDNDDEGRAFAARASASIDAAGGRSIILALPDLPAKGDIIDWRGTVEQLHALLAPRGLFDGRTPIDACLELEGCNRAIVLHGLALGLDADANEIDGLLADEPGDVDGRLVGRMAAASDTGIDVDDWRAAADCGRGQFVRHEADALEKCRAA